MVQSKFTHLYTILHSEAKRYVHEMDYMKCLNGFPSTWLLIVLCKLYIRRLKSAVHLHEMFLKKRLWTFVGRWCRKTTFLMNNLQMCFWDKKIFLALSLTWTIFSLFFDSYLLFHFVLNETFSLLICWIEYLMLNAR